MGTPINITQGQYNEALAKWNSLQIVDYEETVQTVRDELSRRVRMVVHIDRTNEIPVESVRSFETLDYTETHTDTLTGPLGLAVGELFQDLGFVIQYPDGPPIIFEGPPRDTRYNIEFDPTLGYPRSETFTLFDQASGAFVVSASVTVEGIKVLK